MSVFEELAAREPMTADELKLRTAIFEDHAALTGADPTQLLESADKISAGRGRKRL